jgi:hypothetical protein
MDDSHPGCPAPASLQRMLGTSTSWPIVRSTATLQIAHACCRQVQQSVAQHVEFGGGELAGQQQGLCPRTRDRPASRTGAPNSDGPPTSPPVAAPL